MTISSTSGLGNYGINENTKTKSKSAEEKKEHGVAVIISNRDGWKGTTVGLRTEREIDIVKGNVFKLSAVGANNVNFNKHSFNIEPGVGVKAQVVKGNVAGLYTTVMGTANLGVLGGNLTAGVGARGAVGAELGPLYGEYFGEMATNYKAHGFAGGVRFKF